MIHDLSPAELTWDEVDPSRHSFDAASAAEVVRSLGPARCVPTRPDGAPFDPELVDWRWNVARRWADAMSHALGERYGRWALGWRWAHDEGDFDGGPVGNWCCAGDSVDGAGPTLEKVVAALREWRAWTERLADLFDSYPLDPATVGEDRILWERVARNLVVQVADRTGSGSGWYRHCRQVLSWFLSRWGVPPELADELVDRATEGRFHSWTAPDTADLDAVAERLAASLPVTAHASPGPPPDHLRRWLEVRQAVRWRDAPDPGPGESAATVRDGAAEHIRAFDGAIDPARAEGLLAALDALRADAARGATLDFALLSGWQRHVLGAERPPAFRTLPAFAKGGRERYGIGPDTRARLDACLAESAPDGGEPLPLPARAARAYLDVCFFHPFDDGNARSAFLALLFVLAREGVTLNSVALLRLGSFEADRPEDPMILARYVDTHLRDC